MAVNKTQLLNKRQIAQKVNRIAWQIYEDCFDEKEIFIVGIQKSGFIFARKLVKVISEISGLKTTLVELKMNKENPIGDPIELSLDPKEMAGKTVVLVDDVLNSGKTLTYSLRKLLNSDLKKLRTVLLVDRDHKRYPVVSDFTGITLSTTLQDHIEVVFGEGEEAVYLHE